MKACPECDGEMQPQTFKSKLTGRVHLSDEVRCTSCGHEVVIEAAQA